MSNTISSISPDITVAGEYLSGSAYSGPHLHEILKALMKEHPEIPVLEESNIVNVLDYDVIAEGNLYYDADQQQYRTLDDLLSDEYNSVDTMNADERHRAKWDISDQDAHKHHDDTDGIQAAINDVAAKGGGVVYFPKLLKRQQFYRLDKAPYDYYNPSTDTSGGVYLSDVSADVPNLADLSIVYYDTSTKHYVSADNETTVPLQDLRAQLYIPQGTNIFLVGEVPPVPLKHYHVLDGWNNFGFINYGQTWEARSPVLRSSIDAPGSDNWQYVQYSERPWAVIAAPSGRKGSGEARVTASSESFGIQNLEIRVHFDCVKNPKYSCTPKLFPTMGGINMGNARRVIADNVFIGLDNEVGSNYFDEKIPEDQQSNPAYRQSYDSHGKCLQKSPTTTIGMLCTIEDCERQILQNVTIQGFKFGLVVPEMTNAAFVHISNCEYAMCFIDCTHLTLIEQLSTHNNRRCICALPIPEPTLDSDTHDFKGYTTIFGNQIFYREWITDSGWWRPAYKPTVNVKISMHDFEHGHFSKPFVSQMKYGIWDPQNRFHGQVMFHQGFPGGTNSGPINWGTGFADRLVTLLSIDTAEELSNMTTYDRRKILDLSAYGVLSVESLADLSAINVSSFSISGTYGVLSSYLTEVNDPTFAIISAWPAFNDLPDGTISAISDDAVRISGVFDHYELTKCSVLGRTQSGQNQWRTGTFDCIDHCYYDHRGCNYANVSVESPVFEESAWLCMEYTREKYDFFTANAQYLSNMTIANLSDWEWQSENINVSSLQLSDSVTQNNRALYSAYVCPSGYIAINYGSYYPVLCASNMTIAQQNDDYKTIYTKKTEELINTTGYAMRRNTSEGALVFSGGSTYDSGESETGGNARIVLFGGDHELYPGQVSIASGSGKYKDEHGVVHHRLSSELTMGNGILRYGNTGLAYDGSGLTGDAFAKASMPHYTSSAIDLKYVFTYDAPGSDIATNDASPLPWSEVSSWALSGGNVLSDFTYMQNLAISANADVLSGTLSSVSGNKVTYKLYRLEAPATGYFIFYNTLPQNTYITVTVKDKKVGGSIVYAQSTNTNNQSDGSSGYRKSIGITVPCAKGQFLESWVTGSTLSGYDTSVSTSGAKQFSGVCRFVRTYANPY